MHVLEKMPRHLNSSNHKFNLRAPALQLYYSLINFLSSHISGLVDPKKYSITCRKKEEYEEEVVKYTNDF